MTTLCRRRCLTISVLLIGVMFCSGSCVSSAIAQKQKSWSRGFSWTVSKTTGDFRFMLFNVNQDEHELTGQFSSENYVLDNEARQTVGIGGTRTSDGRFWPEIALAVKKDGQANWEPLKRPEITGERAKVAVAPWDIKYDLIVSLEPFKPLIGKYEVGRVILPTGEAAQFELKLLKPRED